MSAYQEAIGALADLVQSCQPVYGSITIGAMPAEDSLVIAPSAGGVENVGLDLAGDLNLDFVCNAKHREQKSVLAALGEIHRLLPRAVPFPTGDGWQILSISTSSAPTFIEFDGDQYLYGSGLEVHIYIE